MSTLRSAPRAVVAFSLLAGLFAGSCATGGSDTRVLEVGVGEVPPAQSSTQNEGGSAAASRAASASVSESLSGSASAAELLSVASNVDSSRASSQASLVAEISNSQSRRASQMGELTSTARGAIVATPPASTLTTLAASTRAPATAAVTTAAPVTRAAAPQRATTAATTVAKATSAANGVITLAPNQSLVATATVAKVAVYSAPGSKVVTSLRNPQSSGFPLVFLAVKDTGDWLQVYLPIRPNGSTGWIQKRDVALTYHDYRIVVELSAHRLTVLKAGAPIMSEPIGVGTSSAPTPGGFFYTKEILKVPNPGGPYGPYAYGLSGFSDVYETFGSGPGTIGIHGTNDPSSLGRDVSHGCIRLNNSAITKIAGSLPIGVPVEIRP